MPRLSNIANGFIEAMLWADCEEFPNAPISKAVEKFALDKAKELLAPAFGPSLWPQPLAPAFGPSLWPQPLAPAFGPSLWPQPLAPALMTMAK